MYFSFHPENEDGCGHPERCPHLDGAPLGFLVTLQGSGEETRMQLHKQLDAERKRSSDLASENTQLEEKLAQAKLELKLERQNKFATNEQKSGTKDEPVSREEAKNAVLRWSIPVGSARLPFNRQEKGVISFTSNVQFVLQEWKLLSKGKLSEANLADFIKTMLKGIAGCLVANRPGRIEPRVVKKRPKSYSMMTKPRAVLKQELLNS